MYILLPLVFILALSCQNRQNIAELEKFRQKTAMEEKNIEIVRRWIEEVNEDNFEALYKELFSKEFRHYVPSNAEASSFEDYKENGAKIYSAFQNLTHSIEDLIAKDNKVIARMTARAKHAGDFYNIPASGNELEWSAIAIFELSDGKITARWEEVNLLGLFRQMGMELQRE